MRRGFVYLAAVVDVASRRVLAHRVSIGMEAAFCIEALEESSHLASLAFLTRRSRSGERCKSAGTWASSRNRHCAKDFNELLAIWTHFSRGFARTHDTRTRHAVEATGGRGGDAP